MTTAPVTHTNLDRQLEQKAAEYGIGVAKLKTVYFRGVEEYHSSDFDMGTPTMWGLARVQRFINCVATGTPMMSDEDLVSDECVTHQMTDALEINLDTSSLTLDVLYGNGALVAEMFKPGAVNGISLEDDTITVDGELDGTSWQYTLNMVSGDGTLALE